MNYSPTKISSVLLVDDSATMIALLRTILVSAGYKVVGEIKDGKHLRAAIAQYSPDIICLDYNLPDSNGLDLLKAIKSTYPAVAVVMITGNADPDIEEKAAKAGAAGFIHKPFTENTIIKQLQQVSQAQNFLAKSVHSAEKSPSRATAVIADDSNTMRAMLSFILSSNGIEVLGEASNGNEAIDLVSEHKPDLVCLDVEMPILSGLEAIEMIRLNSPDTKIVMITGNANKNVVTQSVKHGVKGFIVKPFNPEKVGEELKKLLKL